jgi:hypothetical protein
MHQSVSIPKGDTYPKIASYGECLFDARPFTTSTSILYSPLDMGKISRVAKFDYIIMDPPDQDAINGPIVRALYAALRSFNPSIQIIPYFDVGQPFQCGLNYYGQCTKDPGCSSDNFLWARWLAIGQAAGIVYKQEGGGGPSPSCPAVTRTNFGWLTDPNLLTTDFAVAGVPIPLADVCLQWMNYDTSPPGIFIDESPIGGILWMENGSQHIDYARDGFGSLAAWDTAFQNGLNSYWARIRAGLNSQTQYAIGNAGHVGYTNGTMYENWPNIGSPTPTIASYLADCKRFIQPTMPWLTTWKDTSPSVLTLTASDIQRAKEVFGVATLGTGVGVISGGIYDGARGWVDIWLDEYAVDSNGAATTSTSGKRWLGHRLTEATTDANGLYFSTFEHGCVVCNRTGITRTFTLPGSGYRRILGVDSQGNNGQAVTTQSVPSSTAVFFWKP